DTRSADSEPTPLHVAFADAEARLSEWQARPPEVMRFRCFDLPFRARLEGTAFGRGTLHLEATLGQIPYTAEDAAARRLALRHFAEWSGSGADRLRIAPDSTLHLESATVFDLPVDRHALLARLTLVLLNIEPLIAPLKGCLRPAP
ncbi:MAG: hypothetical protein D6807_05005, partial [Alphaproteobacteria bacterium]